MKTRIFKCTWPKTTVKGKPFSLWVVYFGRKYHEITRYFYTWDEAVEYVVSGKAADEQRRIDYGLY